MKKQIFIFGLIVFSTLLSCTTEQGPAIIETEFSGEQSEVLPQIPILEYPFNNLDKCDINTKLEWQASIDVDGNAVTYEVIWGELDQEKNVAKTTDNFLDITINAFNAAIEWQVIAIDSKGNRSDSELFIFKTKAIEDFLYKESAWYFPQNESFDVCALHNDGSMIGYEFYDNNKPSKIIYKKNQTTPGVYIEATTDGLPSKVVVDGSIFIFSNYNFEENTFDLGIIKANKQIEILRGLDFDNGSNLSLSDYANLTKSARTKSFTFNDGIRWAGYTASFVGCGFSIAAAASTGGLAIPLAVLSCTAALNNIAREYIAEEGTNLSRSSTIYSNVADFIGLSECLSTPPTPLSLAGCSTSAVAVFSDIYGWVATDAEDTLEDADVEIGQVENILEFGSGRIQVTLSWENTADLDLWITDPSGEKIYYHNKTSESGGYLDVDDTNGYGPENIYWEESAPSGTYKVQVDHFSGATNSDYIITINAFGNTETYTGTLNSYETVTIADFTESEITPVMSSVRSSVKRGDHVKK